MKTSRVLVLGLALVASIYATNYLVGCSEEKSSNPIESVVMQTDDTQIQVITNPNDTIVSEQLVESTFVAARLAGDPRQAVIQEGYYALNPGHYGYSSKYINGCAVSDWNYLANDLNAYSLLKGSNWYGSYASGWSLFYSNPSAYGFSGGYGRGGQCVYFANLLTYRSGVYQAIFPTYATCLNDYNGARRYTKPYRNIQPGDIIRTYATNGHTAIVVAVLAGTPGSSVTSVDVIDANYIGNEIIGRHIISSSGSGNGDLDNYYAVDLIALGGR